MWRFYSIVNITNVPQIETVLEIRDEGGGMYYKYIGPTSGPALSSMYDNLKEALRRDGFLIIECDHGLSMVNK